MSGSGGNIAGRPGVRGPGREPVGTTPGLCVQGRPATPEGALAPAGAPERGVNGRPPWPVCERMGCPGRGPLGRSLRGSVPGRGPRLPPVGTGGRGGIVGLGAGVVAPAAGRAPAGGALGWTFGGAPCGGRTAIGWPGAGRRGAAGVVLGAAAGAVGAVEAGAGAAGLAAGACAGAAGFAAAVGVADSTPGTVGFGRLGATLGAACAVGA